MILSITGIITRNIRIFLYKTMPAESFVLSAGIILLTYVTVAFCRLPCFSGKP